MDAGVVAPAAGVGAGDAEVGDGGDAAVGGDAGLDVESAEPRHQQGGTLGSEPRAPAWVQPLQALEPCKGSSKVCVGHEELAKAECRQTPEKALSE